MVNKKKILIVGHLGYVGATLIRYLRREYPQYELIGYDNGYFEDDKLLGAPEVLLNQQYRGDIRKFNIDILEGVDTIIALSAISNDPISKTFEEVTTIINTKAIVDLAIHARRMGVKNFIFASSCSVYGFSENGEVDETSQVNPLTPYSKSKYITERYLEDMWDNEDMKITCLRFATACGYSDRLRLDLVLNDFVASALNTGKIEIMSDGTPWRPLIDTIDMSRAIDWAIHREGNLYEVVNVGSYNYQVIEIAKFVKEKMPEIEITINPDAVVDKRSYKVNFDKFKKLAPGYFPKESIGDSIEGLIWGLNGIKLDNFREGTLIRLNKLNKLINHKQINNNLEWVI